MNVQGTSFAPRGNRQRVPQSHTPSRLEVGVPPSARGSLLAKTLHSNHVSRQASTAAGRDPPRASNNGTLAHQAKVADSDLESWQAGTHMSVATAQRPLGPSAYKLGQILVIPHIKPALDPHQKDHSDVRVYTKKVGFVCPKPRFAAVVAIYPTRMVVLPMYSSNGNGLKHKPDEYKLTALSVWVPLTSDDEVRKQLTEDALKAVAPKPFTAGSHVNLNDPWTVNYAGKIQQWGQLDEASTKRLLERYQIAFNMATAPVVQQASYFKNQIQRLRSLPAGTVTAAGTQFTEAPRPTRTTLSYASMASGPAKR
ncbi:hypothetical protein LTS08_005415 [Lithohypha guttulata]|uniref:Uncharacterized protein n=1 Tax=Lithohypha guttulata TaxID=1690604 RepID=A0AAN7T880_9EURO|nr:hypothetical protein LTR05_001839 [Lithohypha guttulata]KAK5100663.1 hypothetical protein LTS08_005415 [Lithohypha guttulata]